MFAEAVATRPKTKAIAFISPKSTAKDQSIKVDWRKVGRWRKETVPSWRANAAFCLHLHPCCTTDASTPIDWGTVILSIDSWEEMKQTDSR
jgi:hypothetical protein